MQMRLFLLVVLHALVILFLSIIHPQAEEDDGWTIDVMDNFIYLSKNGEVIHGDKLRFAMFYNNCDEVHQLFSFLTTKASDSIRQLEKRRVPITINNHEFTAEVMHATPVLNTAYWVMFQLGKYETKKYGRLLSGFLKENEKYEIVLKDGLNFEAEKFFDITHNSWVLDNFSEKYEETYKRCKEKSILKDS